MRGLWATGALLGVAAATAGPASPPSLCEQLAVRVRQSPATVWESRGTLGPWIALTDAAHAGDAAVVTAARAAMRQAMSDAPASPGSEPVLEVERLPGTQLLMGSTLAGTAHCQTSVFVQMGSDLDARLLPNPSGDTRPCWNVHGDLGRVLDQAAYIVHGTLSDTGADPLLIITPWQSGHWGEACRLTIHLAVEYALAERFCGADAELCRTGADAAADVAHRYDGLLQSGAARQTSAPGGLVPAFRYGGPQDGTDHETVERALRLIGGENTDVAEFPLFGHFGSGYYNAYEYTYSYGGFTFFPWSLAGRTYLGAVGHAGIGWRGSTRVLVAVYALPGPADTTLVPVAGFTVDPHPNGLSSLEVTTGRAAVARD